MKLTKETLKRIIKEEMSALIKELGEPSFGNPEDPRDDMYKSITGHGPEDSMHSPLTALKTALEKKQGDLTNFKFEETEKGLEVEYESTDPNSEFYGTALVSAAKEPGFVIIDGNEMSIEQAVMDLNGDSKY